MTEDAYKRTVRADPEAPEWRQDPWYDVFVERTTFARAFCHGARVLDAPCGVGWAAKKLAEVASEVHGIDSDPEAIDYAKGKYAGPNISYAVMDALDPAYPDARFDTAVSLEALEHFTAEQGNRYLRQLHRMLVAGGRIVGSTPAARDAAEARRMLKRSREKGHRWIYTREALRRKLEVSFREVAVVPMPQPYFLFCGTKRPAAGEPPNERRGGLLHHLRRSLAGVLRLRNRDSGTPDGS